MLHEGACVGKGEACTGNSDCSALPTSFCRKAFGVCTSTVGVCAGYGNATSCPRSTRERDAVCSCSGKDYSNVCTAIAHQESVASIGYCTNAKSCHIGGHDCDASSYCRTPYVKNNVVGAPVFC